MFFDDNGSLFFKRELELKFRACVITTLTSCRDLFCQNIVARPQLSALAKLLSSLLVLAKTFLRQEVKVVITQALIFLLFDAVFSAKVLANATPILFSNRNPESLRSKDEISIVDKSVKILTPVQIENEKKISKAVKEILSKMTLEEKVGQMTQITLETISDKIDSAHPHKINVQKLKDAILKYHIGSVLNVANDKAFEISHWHEVITTIQDQALKDRLKIPVIYGIDSIHGAHYTRGATIFPQSINLSATWTPKFSNEVGRITALETRATGIPWNFFPILDIGRQLLWTRVFETYGEDVYLAKSMGEANIKGQQGDGLANKESTAACMKHYLGYSYPTSGKDKTPVMITERMMREYFLPTFAAAVKAGAETVMINTSEIDGIPGHANYHLITEVLKNELGFKGFAVSDWMDIKKLYERDHFASSPEEAVEVAVMSGIDMSMVPYDYSFPEILAKLVKQKKVPMHRIDDAVSRILRVKFLLDLFEAPYPDKSLLNRFALPESQQVNQRIASESITLLKNENRILPLKKGSKILVTGPTGNLLSSMNGAWTVTWQGDDEELLPKNKKTVYEALKAKWGSDKVNYIKGVNLDTKSEDYESALATAKKADVILLCLGEKTYTEIPGNIDDITLDEVQLQFALDLYKTGKPVVLLLLEGRPRVISKIEKGAAAIVMGYLPGMEGGLAIADILAGDVNPSGKLPITYPRAPNDLLTYDHKYSEEKHKYSEDKDDKFYNPQWPFGYGLSYTTFEYSQLSLNRKQMGLNDELEITVQVKNTGDRPGQEVVQLYLSQLYRKSVTGPVKQLKGFQKIALEPNEIQKVKFKISLEDLSFIGRDNKRIAEKGDYKISVDSLSGSFRFQ